MDEKTGSALSFMKSTLESSIIQTGKTNTDLTTCSTAIDVQTIAGHIETPLSCD